jgi:hypothetical protein
MKEKARAIFVESVISPIMVLITPTFPFVTPVRQRLEKFKKMMLMVNEQTLPKYKSQIRPRHAEQNHRNTNACKAHQQHRFASNSV